jgi:ABC-type nitrate/sulfonate/bicarbonate transport system substrate-binding protein
MTSTYKNVLRGCAVVGVLLAAVAGCGGGDGGSASSAKTQTLRVGSIKASVCTPTLQWQKYLPSNVKVDITYFTDPADQVAGLNNGSLDAVCTGVTIGLVANEKGQKIRVVSNLAEKGTSIVAKKGSGIADIAGLKGKTIGYTPNSIHDVLLRERLHEVGLDPAKDVTLKRLDLIDMPQALCSGAVDAFSGNEPNSTIATQKGCGTVIDHPYDTPVGGINVAVLTSQALIDRDPKLVQTFVDANQKAVAALKADPSQIVKLSQQWGYDPEATQSALQNIELTSDLPEDFPNQYQSLADQLKDIGLLTTHVDASTVVTRTFATNGGS